MIVKEADIIIEGRKLSFAESMTVRVALTHYLTNMEIEGLGDDEHGIIMSEAYITNCKSILNTVIQGCN